MSPTSPVQVIASEDSAITAGTWALVVLTVLHFLVDTTAGQLNPLWPVLREQSRLGSSGNLVLLVTWGFSTSFCQLLFGLLGDSAAGRWLVWIGPAAGVICLGSLGLTSSTLVLIAWLAIGGLGIAAFHPEAATLAGNCWPTSRSRAMSIFAMGGFLGQSVGPSYSGYIVEHYGLAGLSYGIGVGLLALLALRLAYRDSRPSEDRSSISRASNGGLAVLRERRSVIHLLLLVGTFRVVAASGVPIVIAYWLASKNIAKTEIGAVQSVFMMGIGLGGLICAVSIRPRTEHLALWLVPLLAVPCLVAMPQLSGLPLSVATGMTGLLLGIALPVFISYGQQILPESQRLASSITMGVSWGTGGAIVAVLIDICDRRQSFDAAFITFAISVVASSVLCWWLPRPEAASQSTRLADSPESEATSFANYPPAGR